MQRRVSPTMLRSLSLRGAAAALSLVLTAEGYAKDKTVDCGYEGVSIEGTSIELERSCAALDQVLAAFKAMDVRVEPSFRLLFKEKVFIDLVDDPMALTEARGAVQVSAFFDDRHKRIEMTSFDSPREGRHPWGIEWRTELKDSILHHELAHMATSVALGNNYANLGKAWHEFIAFAVEFEVMDPSLRQQVLINNPDVDPFTSDTEVNEFIYGFDPDQFGLRAYLTARANGGMEFIGRILAGDTSFKSAETLKAR